MLSRWKKHITKFWRRTIRLFSLFFLDSTRRSRHQRVFFTKVQIFELWKHHAVPWTPDRHAQRWTRGAGPLTASARWRWNWRPRTFGVNAALVLWIIESFLCFFCFRACSSCLRDALVYCVLISSVFNFVLLNCHTSIKMSFKWLNRANTSVAFVFNPISSELYIKNVNSSTEEKIVCYNCYILAVDNEIWYLCIVTFDLYCLTQLKRC